MTTEGLLSLHNARFRLFGAATLQGQGDVAFIDRLVSDTQPEFVAEGFEEFMWQEAELLHSDWRAWRKL